MFSICSDHQGILQRVRKTMVKKRGARILVVDDQWLIRLEVEEMLTALGYSVVGLAETGRQAVEMARNLRPDLILMDVVMPGELNGIEAAGIIKSETDIAIIFISGYGEPEYIEKAKKIEPFGYVMKPFDEREVRAFVEIALHKKAMEEALRKSEEKYREFVEGTDDLITQVDGEGVFIYVNHAAEKIFGMRPDQCVGVSAFDFVHPEDREKTRKILVSCVRDRQDSITFENRQVNQVSGEVRHMNWTINPHYDDEGEIVSYNSIGQDLSDRKKLEDAAFNASKLKSLGVLAGGIAHDFNSLMATVVANIGLAKMEVEPGSKAFEKLVEAEKSSIETKKLTAWLITFSQGGGPIKEISPVSDLLKDSVSSSLKGSDISCQFSIHGDISPVEIDVEQMRQVIYNVTSNAQKAMAGEGTICVSCENVDIRAKDVLALKNGRHVKISIKDQGIGIPQESLAKVFDPYFSTQEMGAQKGVGLGLAISDSIIKKHDGVITVESQSGKGTTVSIYLPAISEESVPGTHVKLGPAFHRAMN